MSRTASAPSLPHNSAYRESTGLRPVWQSVSRRGALIAALAAREGICPWCDGETEVLEAEPILLAGPRFAPDERTDRTLPRPVDLTDREWVCQRHAQEVAA